MGLVISEPIVYSPDFASEENNFVNESYTYQAGTCSACGWGCRVEEKSSKFDQTEVEIEIRRQFEAHKANCRLTKYQGLYKETGTTASKIAVIAKMLGLVEA